MIRYKFYIKIYEYIIHVAIEIKMLPIISSNISWEIGISSNIIWI